MTLKRCGVDNLQKAVGFSQNLSEGVEIEPRGKRQDMT